IPTVLSFSLPEDLVVGRVKYPAGALISFPFDPSQKLSVYSGDFTVRGLLIAQPKAASGPYTVHAELKYQACDNNACYPPKKLPLSFNVKISSGGGSLPRARPTRTSPHIHGE
ncbi:MAG: protein-disulfide reductase DsbD domain-containing protein, partial [Candidatus Angelobacter sp.]